ncbi:hypothetical protein, partial [Novosphingobium sp.]|uniref:hypothetical protein n=1 Tax=Novosphingobium sp. TaxID=1874826 RepID=UPI0035AD9143
AAWFSPRSARSALNCSPAKIRRFIAIPLRLGGSSLRLCVNQSSDEFTQRRREEKEALRLLRSLWKFCKL